MITSPSNYPIQPHNIGEGLPLAFGGANTNGAAWWVVRFCRARGKSWEPFTLEELADFYRAASNSRDGFSFFKLCDGEYDYLVQKGNRYFITHEFVATYFLAEPIL